MIVLSALAMLHARQQSTRLSRLSYAVMPRRGVTWSSVRPRAVGRFAQYAQVRPCCATSHFRVSAYAARPVGIDVSRDSRDALPPFDDRPARFRLLRLVELPDDDSGSSGVAGDDDMLRDRDGMSCGSSRTIAGHWRSRAGAGLHRCQARYPLACAASPIGSSANPSPARSTCPSQCSPRWRKV